MKATNISLIPVSSGFTFDSEFVSDQIDFIIVAEVEGIMVSYKYPFFTVAEAENFLADLDDDMEKYAFNWIVGLQPYYYNSCDYAISRH